MAWERIEGDPDGPPDGGAEGPGDDEILPTPLHLPVGGDLRDGQRRRHGDHVAEKDDEEGPQKTGMSHRIAEAEEHDGTEDGADAGQEHRAGSEAVPFVQIGLDRASVKAPSKVSVLESGAGTH